MKIREAIDYDELREFLNSPISSYHEFGDVYQTSDGVLIHKDVGASILAVAHLDSVNQHNHFHVNQFAGEDYIFSTHLDDRLGAYIILAILPRMGIHTDLLLTEGEEVGKSTAAHFVTDKQYKWMFSFDRRGTDAVHYRYTAKAWQDALKVAFGIVGHGSNSDIDYLSHLKCCGVNVGTGYHEEHALLAHANMNETISMIGKFMQFYHTNKSTFYEHVPYVPVPYKYTPPTYYQKPREEPEEQEVPPFNPYEEVVVDVPLDWNEYVDNQGVYVAPTKCGFCLAPLTAANRHVFVGICSECERWALECVACEEFFCRTDDPEDDDDLQFYGICSVCEQYDRRFIGNETTGFSRTNHEPIESDGTNQGDEGNPFG